VNRPFRFQKCCQDFIGTHNETVSIVAMRVNKAKIAAFAKAHGFRLIFYKPGLCAMFEKESDGK
jgi:hypothetical protein